MKKFLAVALASLVAAGTFAFVGCGDSSDNGSGSFGKPGAPSDKNMTSVKQEDIYEVAHAYYSQIRESKHGQFQTYAFRDKKSEVDREFKERVDGEFTDTVVEGKYRSQDKYESSTAFGGMKDNGVEKGAYTCYNYSAHISGADGNNPNLEDYSDLYISDTKHTGIQNGSHIYCFVTPSIEDKGGSLKEERYLSQYTDNLNIDKQEYTIPCIQITELYDHAYWTPLSAFETAIRYNETKDIRYLLNSDDFELADQITMLYDVKVKNFSFSAKKNDKKCYASLKYYIECTSKSDDNGKITIDCEYVTLFDLSSPKASDLPTDGIDLSSLSLSSTVGDAACPNLTGEQITQAVKEGKDITVDIIGRGDKEKLTVYWLDSLNILPIVDGKVTFNGAEIKEQIDEMKPFYESMGLDISFSIVFAYGENNTFKFMGFIYIDY